MTVYKEQNDGTTKLLKDCKSLTEVVTKITKDNAEKGLDTSSCIKDVLKSDKKLEID